MLTPRKDWTILIGVDLDLDQATANAIQHVSSVFEGLAAGDRPRVVLFNVIEQSLAPGAEFGEPSFAWDAGGITGMTPPVSDQELQEFQSAAIQQLEHVAQQLVNAGWSREQVECKSASGGFSKALIADVLAFHAKENGARVVVVGRTRHGRLHEALLKSIGERLTHYLPGITVWVVGTPEDDETSDDGGEGEG